MCVVMLVVVVAGGSVAETQEGDTLTLLELIIHSEIVR